MSGQDFSRLREALLALKSPHLRRGLYGQRYAEAEVLSEIYLQAGEAVFVAASTLFVDALRRPTTGGIPRRLFEQQSPERYERFRQEEDATWAWAVALVADKFTERLGRVGSEETRFSIEMLEAIYERVGACAMSAYLDLAAGSEEEEDLERICRILLAYADSAPIDDSKRLQIVVENIPTSQPREARLSSALALPNIELITEPQAFHESWLRLQSMR